jgi:hypothetical protein
MGTLRLSTKLLPSHPATPAPATKTAVSAVGMRGQEAVELFRRCERCQKRQWTGPLYRDPQDESKSICADCLRKSATPTLPGPAPGTMAPREQRENVMAPLEYTYALQYYAMNEQGNKVWKFATTTANEVMSGLLRAKPGVNLAEHGPRLLKKMLQMPGAENGWFRLVFWEGNVPNEELDDRRSCATIYEEATIVSGSEQVDDRDDV